MNTFKSAFALITIVVALAAASAWGQDEEQAPPGPTHHMHGGFMDHGMGLPLHELNLSDDQRSQIRQIFENEHANIKPLMAEEMRYHQQLIQLVTSGNFEQVKAKVTAIAAQESQTHVQLEVEHAKIASQIYQLLNTEQKAKAAEIIQRHFEKMQQHLSQPESAPPSAAK